MPAPPSEILVILGPGSAAPAATEVVHAVSPRVFVTTAPDTLPAGVLFAGRAPPADVLAGLDEGERLFVDGWLARHATSREVRPGDGEDWDAPGRLPPDLPA